MPQIQVRNITDKAIELCNFTVSKSSNPEDPYLEDFFTDFSGNSSWPRYGIPSDGYFLHVNYFNHIHDYDYQVVEVPKGHTEDVPIVLQFAKKDRATIDGYYSNVFFKGESAFLDLARLCVGQDIKPLLVQSLELTSNGRRNFLMSYNTAKAGGLNPFNPDDFCNYYDKLEELLKLYADYGLYLYGSVFPDNGLFPSWKDKNKQRDHWNKIGDIAVRHDNFWGLELTNEINSKSFNEVDQDNFSEINGVICCRGSWTDDSSSPLTWKNWKLADFHQRRDYPKSVVDAAVANYPVRYDLHIATMLGESVGFGDKTLNPNREDNPRIAKEIAGTGRGTSCGMIFHSQHGGFSQLYDQTELRCAEAWFNELHGV